MVSKLVPRNRNNSPEMTLRTSIVCKFLMQLITQRSDVLAVDRITSTHCKCCSCHTTQYAATNTPRWRHLPSPLPKVGADAHGVYHAVTRRPHRPRKGRRPGAAHVFWLRVPGHEAVVLGSNINSSNSLIVSSEFI